jgi:hypothetical protein
VTKVTRRRGLRFPIGLLLAITLVPLSIAGSQEPSPEQKPAETLYLQLRNIGLDKSRVYHVREVAIDRSSMHITLDDGIIGFTQDVAGHVTGAFFEGDGELLLRPPDRVERASMALFTGAAILEEGFSTAYFRFDDNTYSDLQPNLRPTDNAEEFVQQWDGAARNLAPMDALQVFLDLSKFLPGREASQSPKTPENVLWHARIQGKRLGTFDLYYNSNADEQISVGQGKAVDGVNYFDVWASFSSPGHVPVRTDDLDITKYKIRAAITLPTQLNAEAWLDMEGHSDCPRTPLFELSRYLQVKEVDLDGRPIEFIHNQALEGTALSRLGNDQIAVVLPGPIPAGKHAVLHFVYGGDVLSDAGGGLLYVGARGTWYPSQHPAMSNFDLEFHSPPGWTLIATGKRVKEKDANDTEGEDTHWVSERPIPLAGFNLGKYERATARAGDDVLVETYASKDVENSFPVAKTARLASVPSIAGEHRDPKVIEVIPLPPPSPARNARAVADNAAQAIDFLSRAYGPYPYDSLSLTQKPGTTSQGWPGLIFLSSFSYLTEGEKSQLNMGKVVRTMTNSVIAHETAHQWWGDLVNWDGYRDQWMIEALADYSSLMLLETQDPARFHAVLDQYRTNLLQKNRDGEQMLTAGPVTLGNRLSSSHFPNGYEVISYERGAWLLHMLRNMLLDAEGKAGHVSVSNDPFIRILHRVRNQYEGRVLSTGELMHAFEQDLPKALWYEDNKSLDWFYQSWVNGTAIPRIELDDLKFQERTSKTVVITGKIKQEEAPDNLVTLVPIYAVAPGKNVLIGQVFVDDQIVSFQLTAPAGTRKVVLDPYHTLLRREK